MKSEEKDFLLTFSDIVRLVKNNKNKLRIGALLFGALGLIYGLTKPIEYHAEATFKEKDKSQAGLGKSLSDFLLTGERSDSEALTIMKSRKLMEQLVQAAGLQAVVVKDEAKFPFFPIQTIRENLLTEYAHFRHRKTPALEEAPREIYAAKIQYNGEVPFNMRVEVISEEDFVLLDGAKNLIGQGKFDRPFSTDFFSITLKRGTDGEIAKTTYFLTLLPLGPTAKDLTKQFLVEPERTGKGLIKISYRHPSRQLAVEHINLLMDLFQEHLRKEHERISGLQINYLLDRQRVMGNELESAMLSHASDLSMDLSSTGFADSSKAFEFLAANQQSFKQKLLSLDMEIERLEVFLSEEVADYEKFYTTSNPEVINKLTAEIRSLKQHADFLHTALKKKPENLNISEASQNEFQGINLSTANEIYVAYTKELNDLESQSIQHQFFINQIGEPSFEISSLSPVLTDNISANMLSKASDIVLALKDQDNRSQREQERLKADLAIQKGFLATHLQQAIVLQNLRQNFLIEKISHLQKINISLIQEQILILEHQIDQHIKSILAALKQEKELIKRNLSELKKEMASLPHKWAKEKLLDQQMEIHKKMVEEVTKLVESKNITNNLEKIQSAPLDRPLLPLHPKSPNLLFLTLLGAAAGAFLSFSWLLARSVYNGVPASEENLKVNDQHVSGALSSKTYTSSEKVPLLDSDLDTLRRLIAFINCQKGRDSQTDKSHAKHLLVLNNKGPYYSHLLAELMAKMGDRVITIDLCFDKAAEGSAVGLLPYLEGKVKHPQITHELLYDSISSGGICRYGNELISSPKFKELLNSLESDYDWIILTSDISPQSAEGENLLEHFPLAAITLSGETLQQLQFPILRNKQHQSYITFLTQA